LDEWTISLKCGKGYKAQSLKFTKLLHNYIKFCRSYLIKIVFNYVTFPSPNFTN